MIKNIETPLTRTKCILIDVDNTLLDFEKSSQLAIIRSCEDFNIPYSENMFDVFLKVNNRMWRQIQDGELTKAQLWQTRWNTIFGAVDIKADGVKFEAEFHRNIFDCAVPIDGAVEALEYLHSKYTVCTASNASYEQQRHRLQLTGMLQYIDKMFVSEQLGAQKPNPAFFKACFNQLNFSPAETLMVCDDIHADMSGSNAFGMRTCWYNPKGLQNDEGIAVNVEIASLSELKSIL